MSEFKEALKQRYSSKRGVSNVTSSETTSESAKQLNKSALDSSREARRLRKAGESQKVINRRLKIAKDIALKAAAAEKRLKKKK